MPFLAEACSVGLLLAVATSAPKKNVDFVLDGLDLRGRFDVVVGEADVKRAKPDPEIYLTAASRLQAEPRVCILFEDSLAGVAAGRAAMMAVVGLATTHTPAELHDCALGISDFCRLTVAERAHLA